jgi:transcriptional regulator with XRE-family HTH domain
VKTGVAASRRVLAANLRGYRRMLGLSQEALAARSGLHRTYVGAIERGERNPCLDNLERLAGALGISTATLLAENCYGSWRVGEAQIHYTGMRKTSLAASTANVMP